MCLSKEMQHAAAGILLLGVRRSESSQRAKTLQSHDARSEGRLKPINPGATPRSLANRLTRAALPRNSHCTTPPPAWHT